MSENKEKAQELPKSTGMFGITTDTKATNSAPLLVATKTDNKAQFPSGWAFPIAYLVNVVSIPEFEKKDGGKVPVLQFIFKDKDNRQHIHAEWEIETNDSKFAEKIEGLNVRVKHIYTAVFGRFPDKGIGTTASTFAEFFNEIALAFNSITTGEDDKKKKVYPSVPLYYKLTYYKTRLGFPLSPNFLEKAVDGTPCKLLAINTTYDKLEPYGASKSTGIPGIGNIGSTDDLPSFEEEYK